jgi:hypothetical protein
VTSPWLADLVEIFGGSIAPRDVLDVLLAKLEAFSDRWNFRRMAVQGGVQPDEEHKQGRGAARWLTAPQQIERRRSSQDLAQRRATWPRSRTTAESDLTP